MSGTVCITGRLVVCAPGFYQRFPVSILVDPGSKRSTVNVVAGLVSATASGPVIVRTQTGQFESTFLMCVRSLETFDIVLGLDWVNATGFTVYNGVVLDPAPNRVFSHGHSWRPDAFAGDQMVCYPFLNPLDVTGGDSSCRGYVGSSSRDLHMDAARDGVHFAGGSLSYREYVSSSGQYYIDTVRDGVHIANSSSSHCEYVGSSLGNPYTGTDRDVNFIGGSSTYCRDVGSLRDPDETVTGDDGCSTGSSLTYCEHAGPASGNSHANIGRDCVSSEEVDVNNSQVNKTVSEEDADPVRRSTAFFRLNVSQLICRLQGHGVDMHSMNPSVESLRLALIQHLSSGACVSGGDAPACEIIRERYTVSQDDQDGQQLLRIRYLNSAKKWMKRRPLTRLLALEGLEVVAGSTKNDLRAILTSHILTLTKVKDRVCRAAKYNMEVEAAVRERDDLKRTIVTRWPEVIKRSLKDKVVSMFREATSSESLRTFTCACCAEEVSSSKREILAVSELPLDILRCHSDILESPGFDIGVPFREGVLEGVLLDPDGVSSDRSKVQLCKKCASSLRREKLPTLALANRMYVGPVPQELKDLTDVEELMIAQCRAKCCIVRLKNDGTEGKRKLENMQRGLKGNIIEYPQRPGRLLTVLPPPVRDIISIVCVLFVGSTVPTREWLLEKAKPLAVRKDHVRRALLWLKRYNPLYRDIEIDHAVIDSLPDDGMLPYHVETVSSSEEADMLVSRYDSREEGCSEVSSKPCDTVFQSVVISDVDGHAPESQLRAAAIRHFRKDLGYLEIPHESMPANEFFDPSLFPRMYPTLYLYGIGGFEDSLRACSVSFKRHAKHLFNLADRRFQEHTSFLFVVFNILQRREILLRSSLKVRRESFSFVASELESVSLDAIRRVCERVAQGEYNVTYSDEEKHVVKLMRQVNLVTSTVPGSSSSRIYMRNQIRAMMLQLGMPSFFITINPADTHNPIVKFLAGKDIDINNMEPSDVPSAFDQGVLVAKNPFIAAKFFNLYMEAFFNIVLGYDHESKTYSDEGGVLGHVSGYYGCVEAQGRGTLHCHMLVWLEGALNPNEIRDRIMSGDVEFGARLLEYLDDSISNQFPEVDGMSRIGRGRYANPSNTRGIDPDLPEDVRQIAEREDLYLLMQMKAHVAYAALELAIKRLAESEVDEDEESLHVKRMLQKCAFALLTHQEMSAPQVALYLLGHEERYPSHEFRNLYWKSFEGYVNSLDPSPECYPLPSESLHGQEDISRDHGDAVEDSPDDDLTYEDNDLVDDEGEPCMETEMDNENITAIIPGSISEDVMIALDNEEGKVVVKADQVSDYIYRPTELECISVWYFVRHSCKERIRKSKEDVDQMDEVNDSEMDVDSGDFENCVEALKLSELDVVLNSSRKRRPTYRLLKDHPEWKKKHVKICHPSDLRIVVPIGPALPRRDRPGVYAKYCRLMLVLFKPWRRMIDLREPGQTWSDAFETFQRGCRQDVIEIMNNMQILHECKDNGGDHFRYRAHLVRNRLSAHADEVTAIPMDVSEDLDEEDMLRHVEECSRAGSNSGQLGTSRAAGACLASALANGIYDWDKGRVFNDTHLYGDNCCELCDSKDLEKSWQSFYAARRDELKHKAKAAERDVAVESPWTAVRECDQQRSLIQNLESAPHREESSHWQESRLPRLVQGASSVSDAAAKIDQVINQWTLNEEQAYAFRLIAQHASTPTRDAKQLRMFLGGPGGTGKSRVINALRDFFSHRGEERRFRLASYTGIAASNIGGITLHSALGITPGSRTIQAGSKTHQDLTAMWDGVDYLFVDEVSMLGCYTLARRILNGRVLGALRGNGIALEWKDCPIIVYDNATKDVLNAHGVEAFSCQTGRELHWYYCSDRHLGRELHNSELRHVLLQQHSGTTGGLLGRIPLVLGMKVIISKNFDLDGGVLNGSIGTLRKIRYKMNRFGERQLISCVVHIPECKTPEIAGLSSKEVPVLEETKKWTIKSEKSGKMLPIMRTQVAIQPAYAFTCHRVQGQTFDRVIVDLEGCSGSEAPYVMLSRARSLEGVAILRPFSLKRITRRPAKTLCEENTRLNKICEMTKSQRGVGQEVEVTEDHARSLTVHPSELPMTDSENDIDERAQLLQDMQSKLSVLCARPDRDVRARTAGIVVSDDTSGRSSRKRRKDDNDNGQGHVKFALHVGVTEKPIRNLTD
ncbi:hypothetical protein NM688_g341 [Phlebia brevispora]|uniref:Uncharacterized protein n=1 Tax=Phlebia brevispora TaxID=194682 RepID=A0ACC1TEX2_9APHY|nr:hypothetical protein NM688_g341 [Phlebia brevispora]